MPEISERITKFVNHLESGEEDLDVKLARILENEYRRRLSRYLLTDRLLKKKYQMSFEEFRDQKMVEKLNYSFEAESDFCDWEMSISGIRRLKADLAALLGESHEGD